MAELPPEFVHRILLQFPAEGMALIDSLDREANTSIHIHPIKGNSIELSGNPVPWFERGIILNSRPSFTLDPLFHGGCYYPQESSSMFLYFVLNHLFGNSRELTCLDLCAAPGGKSILLSSFLGNQGRLIANELIRNRNSILRENLTKWGADNTIVTCNEPSDFTDLTHYFDCIVADAPCSGEGMFRKDHAARNEWSTGNVQLCASRQSRIIEDITPSLKIGGYLIYSTCTFSADENENQIEHLLQSGLYEEVKIPVPESWGLLPLSHGLQFLPHKVQGEGFYIAVLRKTSCNQSAGRIRSKPVFQSASKNEQSRIAAFTDTGQHHLISNTRMEYFASRFDAGMLNQLVSFLYITQPGIELGEFIKDEFAPAQALAMSSFALQQSRKYEVDLGQALQYLRGEPIALDGEKGRAIVTYQGIPLGWIKLLGNRTNNYYPKEWRIKMR